jgi:hypothetical protein
VAPETRQERRMREKKQLEQKKDLDEAGSNIPRRLKDRIGKKSEIAENIRAGITRYGFQGLKFTDSENEQEIRTRPLGYDGAQAIKTKADERCLELRIKYFEWWGNKKRVRQIAKKENLSEKTIKRYFVRCPK